MELGGFQKPDKEVGDGGCQKVGEAMASSLPDVEVVMVVVKRILKGVKEGEN